MDVVLGVESDVIVIGVTWYKGGERRPMWA